MIRFQLVSLAGTTYDDEVYELLMPTLGGTIGIFEDHMPIVSAAGSGLISVRKNQSDADEQMEHFATMGGLLEVDGKTVRFLADDVASGEAVSVDEAAAAIERAEQLIKSAPDQTSLAKAQSQLAYGRARLQVARLKKRRHG